MQNKRLRIGTRDSQLAVWQATKVKDLLSGNGYEAELVYIKSDGDTDLQTPLYEMNVQGIFTRSLDTALLNDRIDLAVHSMKDVPTQLPKGIGQAAVLERGSHKDLLVFKGDFNKLSDAILYSPLLIPLTTGQPSRFTIATSSVRRKAQWLNRYSDHAVENLRGNVNTRLAKLEKSNWNGAIFAAAGLERIDLRPDNSTELDWMLPAPAQGAIMIVCRTEDEFTSNACAVFNDTKTALCTKIERDFLRTLLGGCSTPISALAELEGNELIFKGNILTVDGSSKVEISKRINISNADGFGKTAAYELLENGGRAIADTILHGK